METRPNIIQGEDGKAYMDLHDPADELNRVLNPQTGTETEQQWPETDPDVPPPPLLDLASMWKNVEDAVRIPTAEGDINVPSVLDVPDQNAIIVVREFKFYLLAQNRFVPKTSDLTNKSPIGGNTAGAEIKVSSETVVDDETTGPDVDENRPVAKGEADEKKEGKQITLKKKERRSVYGACVLLKLQWDDRTPQKNIEKMDYTELGHFIRDIHSILKRLAENNMAVAKPIVDAFALDLTPIIFARLLDGIEVINPILESAAFDLLMLCAKHANPKEMHLGILGFYKKIDTTYMQSTSYFIYEPLVQVWTTTILRIPRKRYSFLQEFIKVYDKMGYSSQGWHGKEGDTDDLTGVVPQEYLGRCDNVPNLAFEFYVELAELQNEHRKSSAAIREKVDSLGRNLPTFGVLQHMGDDLDENDSEAENDDPEGYGNYVDNSSTSKLPDAAIAEASDWVAERAVLLARTLHIQSVVWNKLAPPAGEVRNVAKRRDKPAKKTVMKLKKDHHKAEEDLCRIISLIRKLGWTDPVLACQVATKGLSLDLMRWEHEAIGDHIGSDMRKRKDLKNSLYSVSAVGDFLCGFLRPKTRKRMEEQLNDDDNSHGKLVISNSRTQSSEGDEVNDYVVDLCGTGFDLLQPSYAFELVLPYLMAMVGQSNVVYKMNGLIALRAFLDQLPDGFVEGMEDILAERCGTRSMGRDVSFLGLTQHVIISVGLLDDPRHRAFAYQTFQTILQLCKNPGVRYSLLEAIFIKDEGTSVEVNTVAGQLVTEMKDAIRYSNLCAWGAAPELGITWSRKEAVELKTRFVQMILPKYLMPRKEMLGYASVIVSVGNACLYVAGSDRYHLTICDEKDEQSGVKDHIEKRVRWMTEMVRLGRSCIRALGSIANHDRETVPNLKMGKKALADAKELYSISGKALHHCIVALSALDMAYDRLIKRC